MAVMIKFYYRTLAWTQVGGIFLWGEGGEDGFSDGATELAAPRPHGPALPRPAQKGLKDGQLSDDFSWAPVNSFIFRRWSLYCH